MREEAFKRIGHLYPKVEITQEMAKDRPDLTPYVGTQRTVIAWLWARTVESPNPAFRGVKVPLMSNFFLSINGMFNMLKMFVKYKIMAIVLFEFFLPSTSL